MSLLQKILQLAPKEWEPDDYRNVRYVLKPVNENSDEFKNVRQFIETVQSGSTPRKVMRVQHPYAYGRYLIKKQQLQQYHDITQEHSCVIYLPSPDSLHTALEYNCDQRQLHRLQQGLWLPQLPFFGAPLLTDYLIIVNKLQSPFQASDSDSYPIYYVELKPKEGEVTKQNEAKLKQKTVEEDSVSSITDMFAKQSIQIS